MQANRLHYTSPCSLGFLKMTRLELFTGISEKKIDEDFRVLHYLPANIRHAMEHRNLGTLEKLAEAANVSTSTVGLILGKMGRRNSSFKILEKVADALNVEPWELLLPPDVFRITLSSPALARLIDEFDLLPAQSRAIIHTLASELAKDKLD